jgi:uncharacterized protein (TIGR00725 family)
MYVAVIGSATCDQQIAALAEAVGGEIARRGAVLICGGRGGVMEAACRGAKESGGLTVGILPGSDRNGANPYVDVPVVTGLGEARHAVVVRSADAVVAVSGGYGTLSEIGLALKMGRPVVGLNIWPVETVVQASTPVEAVEKAIFLAGGSPSQEGDDG